MADETNNGSGQHFEDPVTINFGNICKGALIEAFEIEMEKILRNIADPNTPALAKRTMKLNIEFAPKEDRVQIMTKFQSGVTLASIVPSVSHVFMAKDAEGNLYAVKDDPRQMNIFSPPKPREVQAPIIQFSTGKQ